MTIHLPYGREQVPLDFAGFDATIVESGNPPALVDERKAFTEAVRNPIGAPPLRHGVRPDEQVVLVVPDGTRAFPGARVLPWVLDELSHVPRENITIVIGTGTHRANTRQELRAMLGDDVVSTVRVLNHSAFEDDEMLHVGTAPRGYPVRFNRAYVEADRRILLGFIEPHFVAGFSGGYKAIFPGISGIDAIGRYHDARTIADPGSTWGVSTGNPTQEQVRAAGALAPADFLINLTLDHALSITAFFCGDPIAAHDEGCAFVRSTAMAPVHERFPVVVTTNGGSPLDQNLYQSVKGMSAAAQIAEPGALIVLMAKCDDGFPAHGTFRTSLLASSSPADLLDEIHEREETQHDQWQVQILASILVKHRVALYSTLADGDVVAAHLTPTHDVLGTLRAELERRGRPTRIAVMPQGPYVIPYVAERAGSL